MGGTAPICPFCRKFLAHVQDHVKAVHPDQYQQWITDGQLPYWRYADGKLKEKV